MYIKHVNRLFIQQLNWLNQETEKQYNQAGKYLTKKIHEFQMELQAKYVRFLNLDFLVYKNYMSDTKIQGSGGHCTCANPRYEP